MADPEKLARELTGRLHEVMNDEYVSEELLKKLKTRMFQMINEISYLINTQREAYGKPNFITLITNIASLTRNRAEVFSHVAASLKETKQPELIRAANVLNNICENMDNFRKKLVVQQKFNNADQALVFFSETVVNPFKSSFLSHIEREEYFIGSSLKNRFAPA